MAVIGNLLASGKHVYSLSISHNASERMLPRSRRPIHRCTSTSGQTWLTAARPETHQNLIHTLNDRDARTRPLARTNAPNGNIVATPRRDPMLRTVVFSVVCPIPANRHNSTKRSRKLNSSARSPHGKWSLRNTVRASGRKLRETAAIRRPSRPTTGAIPAKAAMR